MLTKEKFKQMKEATNQGFRAAAGLMRRSTQCITDIRSKHKCASFYQVARDNIERIAYKVMENLHVEDEKINIRTRSLTKGVMKKHINLHVKSLERFYREFINEYKIFDFKSIRDLKKFQSKRLEEEFKNAAHLEVNRDSKRVLAFERAECGIGKVRERKNLNKSTCEDFDEKRPISKRKKMNKKDKENSPPNDQTPEEGDPQGEGNSQNGKYDTENVDKNN